MTNVNKDALGPLVEQPAVHYRAGPEWMNASPALRQAVSSRPTPTLEGSVGGCDRLALDA